MQFCLSVYLQMFRQKVCRNFKMFKLHQSKVRHNQLRGFLNIIIWGEKIRFLTWKSYLNFIFICISLGILMLLFNFSFFLFFFFFFFCFIFKQKSLFSFSFLGGLLFCLRLLSADQAVLLLFKS